MTTDPKSSDPTGKEAREARLAEQLRQNLKRRKEQARARRSSAELRAQEDPAEAQGQEDT